MYYASTSKLYFTFDAFWGVMVTKPGDYQQQLYSKVHIQLSKRFRRSHTAVFFFPLKSEKVDFGFDFFFFYLCPSLLFNGEL